MATQDFEARRAQPPTIENVFVPRDVGNLALSAPARTGLNLFAAACVLTSIAAWWPWLLSKEAMRALTPSSPADGRLLFASTLVFGAVAVVFGILGIIRAARSGASAGMVLSILGLLAGLVSVPWNGLVLLVSFMVGPRGFGC